MTSSQSSAHHGRSSSILKMWLPHCMLWLHTFQCISIKLSGNNKLLNWK